MFHYSISFCWVFNNILVIKLAMNFLPALWGSKYLPTSFLRSPPSPCLIFVLTPFSVTILQTLNQIGLPGLRSIKKSTQKQLITYLRLHDSTEHKRPIRHVLILLTQGADMDCLHSCITYSSDKLTLPEVWFCSSMSSCFPWVLFSGLQGRKKKQFPIFRNCFSELITAISQCSFHLEQFFGCFLKKKKLNQAC